MNNEPKLNFDEQQVDIKHLKEQFDIYNEDEVQEITAAINPMKKKKPCVCDIYSNMFNKKRVEKTYPGIAHLALVKLLCQNVNK